jgi:diamine N-acetyltransferase
MQIIPANSVADYQIICALATAIWTPTYGHILQKEQLDYMFERTYTLKHIAEQASQGQYFYIYYDDENTPKGYASWSWTAPNYAKLNKIYVLPAQQGSHIGRNLLAFIEKTVQNAGATALWLCVNRFNKAKGFYQREGYTLLREEDFEFGPYFMNDFVFEKQFPAN